MTFDALPRYASPTLPTSTAGARWLCGCGETRRLRPDEPWPVCECGRRMFPQAHGVHVGTPADRLERARFAYEARYGEWRRRLDVVRTYLDEPEPPACIPGTWYARWFQRAWDGLVADAEALESLAAELERVEREVARATGGEA